MEMPEEDVAHLQKVICYVSIISTVLSFFLVMTYTCFSEKHRSCTSLLILVQATCAMLLDGFFILPGFYGDHMPTGSTLCEIQGAAFIFFGDALQFCWFFITANIFLRVQYDREEMPFPILFIVTVVCSSLATAIALLMNSITNDGVWCFIDSKNQAMLYTCFYGVMLVLSCLGLPLWVVIIWKMVKSLREERMLSNIRDDESSVTQASTKSSGSVLPTVAFSQKVILLLRQAIYVTGFLIIFFVMLTNRIIITVSGYTYGGWLVHALAIGNLGSYLFLVFGVTERNMELWKNAILNLCFRRKDYQTLSVNQYGSTN